MRNLAPVFWHEGIFLRPHHLQQQDRFQADRLGLHMELLDRFHWGVSGVDIERGALKNRAVEVSRATLVFPGGEVAVVPENAQIDPRSFADHLPPAGQPLEVFLGLPRIRPTEPNYVDAEGRGGDLARYRTRTREILDEATGEVPAAVEFAVANVRILYGDEDRGAFETVKVAEIVQRGPDHFELSDAFVPPSLRIDASPEMLRLCTRVKDSLLAKSRSLHGMKRGGGSDEAALQVMLLAVNTYAGLVNHLVGSGNVPPFQFFSVLASLAGALSSFVNQAEAWDLTPYVHDNPGPSFRDAVQKIEDYLESIGPATRFVEVRLGWSAAESCYAASLTPEHFNEAYRYCLVFSGERPLDQIRSTVHQKAKVSVPDRIPTLVKLALRGAAIKPLDGPPSEIPRRAAAYFHLDPFGQEWDRIKEAKRLSVALPEMTDLNVSLFVIRP
jgi:type VI secretion system protein ImpJ